MPKANDRQIGGSHYKQPDGGEEHWDRVARLGLDYFQACITKYVERWKLKGGIADLEKAQHFLDKYIELNTLVIDLAPKKPAEVNAADLYPMHELAGIDPKAGSITYADFTYEGGTKEWDLYRCKKCREEIRVGPNGDPRTKHDVYALHSAAYGPAGHGYVDQDPPKG